MLGGVTVTISSIMAASVAIKIRKRLLAASDCAVSLARPKAPSAGLCGARTLLDFQPLSPIGSCYLSSLYFRWIIVALWKGVFLLFPRRNLFGDMISFFGSLVLITGVWQVSLMQYNFVISSGDRNALVKLFDRGCSVKCNQISYFEYEKHFLLYTYGDELFEFIEEIKWCHIL